MIKKVLPYILTIIAFAIIASVYYYPALEGYTPKTHDISSYMGMSKETKDYRMAYDDETYWSNNMFGGMPNYVTGAKYETGPVVNLMNFIRLFLPYPVSIVFLSFISFLILGMCLKMRLTVTLIGAMGFGFTTYVATLFGAGHTSKALAISFMPAVLGFFILLYESRKWFFPFVMLSLFLTFELLAKHQQITYYLGFVLVFMGVYYFIKSILENSISKFLLRTGLAISAVILTLLVNFSATFSIYEYSKDTIRGKPIISFSQLEYQKAKNIAKSKNISVYEAIKETKNNPKSIDNDKENFNKTSGLDRDYIVNWSYGKEELYNLYSANSKGGNSENLLNNSDFRENNKDLFLKLNNDAASILKKNSILKSKGLNANQLIFYNKYWGNQPGTSGPNYIGSIIILLAILAMFFVEKKLKWPLFGVCILATLLGLGKNLGGSIENMWLTNFFIDYIPMYNKFRAVSMIYTILNLCIPLLAILFLNDFINRKEYYKQNIKKIAMVIGGFILVNLTIFITPQTFFSFLSNQEENIVNLRMQLENDGILNVKNSVLNLIENLVDYRVKVFRIDALRSMLYVLLTLGTLFFIMKYRKNNKNVIGLSIMIISVLVLLDLGITNRKFFSIERSKNKNEKYIGWQKNELRSIPVNPSKADKAILGREAYFQSKSGLKMKPEIAEKYNLFVTKYKEKNGHKTKQTQNIDINNLKYTALNFSSNYRVLYLDNPFNDSYSAYFHKNTGGYHPAKLRRYQDIIEYYIQNEFRYLNQPEKMKVINMMNTKYFIQGENAIPNPYAYGNAWFVKNIKRVQDNNQELLDLELVDPKETAIIHNEFEIPDLPSYLDTNATIVFNPKDYSPKNLSYDFKSTTNQLAVFSEVYFDKGWNAYIDNEKVDYYRANYILRALYVPAGEHVINFRFEPEQIKINNIVSLIFGWLLLIILVVSSYINLHPYFKLNKIE